MDKNFHSQEILSSKPYYIGKKVVHIMMFDINEDIEEGGRKFVGELLEVIRIDD